MSLIVRPLSPNLSLYIAMVFESFLLNVINILFLKLLRLQQKHSKSILLLILFKTKDTLTLPLQTLLMQIKLPKSYFKLMAALSLLYVLAMQKTPIYLLALIISPALLTVKISSSSLRMGFRAMVK